MENIAFEINILPAGVGDCIHLRFFLNEKGYNIVIDSGPAEYEEQFWELLQSIQAKGEQVDLLCFTHIDDDHIQAAEQVFSSYKCVGDIVKRIWINIPEYEKKSAKPLMPGSLENISVDTALKLYRHILWFEANKQLVCETRILAGHHISFDDVSVTAVLPYLKRWNKLEAWWANKRPYLENISTASSDQSETNGSSIVLLIEAFDRRMLFTGDAFAVDLWSMAKEQQRGFDLVKLPHHGSRANITQRMLKAMRCRHFIISADGSCRRPAQDTMELLKKYGEKHKGVFVYGNYKWQGFNTADGIQIVPLRKKPELPMGYISIRTEGTE